MPSIRQAVAIGGLLVVLLFVAHWAAGIQAGLNIPFVPNPWKGTSPRNADYFNTINAIAVAIVLLIPAIGAFVLRRPRGPGPVWLLLWTAAYIAFCHSSLLRHFQGSRRNLLSLP